MISTTGGLCVWFFDWLCCLLSFGSVSLKSMFLQVSKKALMYGIQVHSIPIIELVCLIVFFYRKNFLDSGDKVVVTSEFGGGGTIFTFLVYPVYVKNFFG